MPAGGKGVLQIRHRRAPQLEPEIAPAPRHAIACVVAGNVEAADKADGNVADQQLAVVANGEAAKGNGIEPADFAAGRPKRLPEGVGQGDRSKRVHQDAHAHVAARGDSQVFEKHAARLIGREDVNLQINGCPGLVDGEQRALEGQTSGGQPAKGLVGFVLDAMHGPSVGANARADNCGRGANCGLAGARQTRYAIAPWKSGRRSSPST